MGRRRNATVAPLTRTGITKNGSSFCFRHPTLIGKRVHIHTSPESNNSIQRIVNKRAKSMYTCTIYLFHYC
jgi:hypothetical protein